MSKAARLDDQTHECIICVISENSHVAANSMFASITLKNNSKVVHDTSRGRH